MTGMTIEALAARVTQLEKSQRRWRRLALFLALALSLPVGLGAAQRATKLQGSELNIVDAAGRPRITLMCDKDGSPTFALTDGEQKDRLMLFLTGDGTPAVVFNDANDKNRMALALGPKSGEPRIELRKASGLVSKTID
jgi:hypothetical protein